MSGVRIAHPSETTCTFTLVDSAIPYAAPFTCALCGRVHLFKTYHIAVDGNGAAIVSTGVWEALQRIPGQPFRLVNEVASPPPLIIKPWAGRPDVAPIVEHRE